MEIVTATHNYQSQSQTLGMFRFRFFIISVLVLLNFRPIFGIDEIPRFYRLLNETKSAVIHDPKRALLLIDSMKMIIRPGDSNFELLIYELESQATFYKKDYFAAYKALIKVDSLLRLEGDQQRLAVNYNRLGVLFTEWGVFDKALENLTKSFKIRVRLGQPDPIMFTLNSMARLYLEMGLDSLAHKSIQQALQYRTLSTDTFNRAQIVFAAGQIFEQLGMYDTAAGYYQEALFDRIAINNYPGVVEAYNALSSLYLKLHNPKLSLSYATKSLDCLSKLDNENYNYNTYLVLLESAIVQGNFNLAMLYARKIQDKVNNIPNLNTRKKAYDLLSKIYEHQGDLHNALLFAKKYQLLQDSLLSQFRLDIEQKIAALQLLQTSKGQLVSSSDLHSEFLKNQIPSFIYIPCIVLIIFFIAFILQTRKIRKLKRTILFEKLARNNFEQETESLRKYLEQKTEELKNLEKVLEWQKDQQRRTEKTFIKSLTSIYDGVQSIVKISERLNQGNFSPEKVTNYHEKLYTLSMLLHQRTKKYLLPSAIRQQYHPNLNKVETKVWLAHLENVVNERIKDNQSISLSFKNTAIPEFITFFSDKELLTELFFYILDLSLPNFEKGTLEIVFKYSEPVLQCLISDSRSIVSPEYQLLIQKWQSADVHESDFDITRYNSSVYNACRIASALGIKLGFEHNGEAGMVFSFSIPVENDVSRKNQMDVPNWCGVHILIAEDEMLVYETMKSFLKPTKAKISHAKTGIEIVEFVKTIKFDLVLLDIKMPRMDGIDALQIIKRTNPTLPVIACTAHASISERENFMQMGFADLIVKPVGKESLYSSLKNLIRVNR